MRQLLAAALTTAAVLAAPARPARGATAEETERALQIAVGYLQRVQKADGSWNDWPGYHGGTTALCTLALLNAGVDPESQVIQNALAHLRRVDRRSTYVVSLRVMAFCAARTKRGTDFDLIRQDVRWLQDAMRPHGMWSYSSSSQQGGGDNSNTQFALLALHEAERFDQRIAREIKDTTWQTALNHWRSSQNADGSWGYVPGDGGTGSMTTAGIASL